MKSSQTSQSKDNTELLQKTMSVNNNAGFNSEFPVMWACTPTLTLIGSFSAFHLLIYKKSLPKGYIKLIIYLSDQEGSQSAIPSSRVNAYL